MTLSNKWISVTEKLPPDGIYVLVHLTKDNWKDSSDPKGVYHDVAKMKKGISKEEREKMKSGELSDPSDLYGFPGDLRSVKRSDIYKAGDEDGNNLRPYSWHTFGPSAYSGQEVDYWMEIPSLPEN